MQSCFGLYFLLPIQLSYYLLYHHSGCVQATNKSQVRCKIQTGLDELLRLVQQHELQNCGQAHCDINFLESEAMLWEERPLCVTKFRKS